MTTQETTDVTNAGLDDAYEIIGELGGRRDARVVIARRRDTGEDVLVSLLRSPEGDEGNALSHFASDANRLAEGAHHNVARIVEARWLDNDTLAVVSERVPFPTLEDMIVRRDEAFACTRVATILQAVNAALEWARGARIVHRAVDPSGVFVEPGSDRVRIAFSLRPLPRAGMPGAGEDARTIATLARAMLTRSVADPERDRLPLRELRPGLPDRLIDQTEDILALAPGDPAPDMSEYIAIVAMSDHLKRAETECAVTTAKLLEEERLAREKIEAERHATERAAAEQARLFQLERDEFAKEREKILAELKKERDANERERAVLAREREEHERDRALLTKEREEHRRWADEVEKAFAAQAAAFAEQSRTLREAERALQEAERERARLIALDAAAREHELARESGPEASFPTRQRATATATPVSLPRRPKQYRVRPGWLRALSHRLAVRWDRRPAWNRRWNLPVAGAALLLLVVISAIAIARSRDDEAPAVQTASRPPQTRLVDSAAGRVVASERAPAPTSVPGVPSDFAASVTRAREAGVPRDLITGVKAASGATPAEAELTETEAVPMPPRPRFFAPPSASREPAQPPRPQPRRDTAVRADTLAPVPPFVPVPPVPRPDTVRRDTLRPPPDTLRA